MITPPLGQPNVVARLRLYLDIAFIFAFLAWQRRNLAAKWGVIIRPYMVGKKT